MTKLFVDRSIDIHAPPQRVWDVLTSKVHTREWASEFTAGDPRLHIESVWELGSPVLWKDQKGHVVVEGNVTAIQPYVLLRFTVFDVHDRKPDLTAEDGIMYKLTEHGNQTRLWVSQGDFAAVADGARLRDLSAGIWERALPKIKWLAERTGTD